MSAPIFEAPIHALVRGVPDAYVHCLRPESAAPDVALAREQHARYVAALVDAGVEVVRLDADEAHPDCCFVEDTAVILGGRGLLTRPGAPSRRGECPAIAAALAARCDLQAMREPAVLDGGDVLRAGSLLFVGLSGRTDEAGARELAGVAARDGLEVRTVPVVGGLHLKSAVTLVDAGTLVLHAGALDAAPFLAAGLNVLRVDEPAGGNVLALGRRVLVSAAAPATGRLLAARGLDVVMVDVSEFHKGDGALTCLSLRVPAAGRWCA